MSVDAVLAPLTRTKAIEKCMACFYRRYTVPSQAVFTRRGLYNDAARTGPNHIPTRYMSSISRSHLVRWIVD
jgi:hypothetical protein